MSQLKALNICIDKMDVYIITWDIFVSKAFFKLTIINNYVTTFITYNGN